MKRRPFVQRTSARKQVLRRRRIHTSFGETWERLRVEARRFGHLGGEPGPTDMGPQARPA